MATTGKKQYALKILLCILYTLLPLMGFFLREKMGKPAVTVALVPSLPTPNTHTHLLIVNDCVIYSNDSMLLELYKGETKTKIPRICSQFFVLYVYIYPPTHTHPSLPSCEQQQTKCFKKCELKKEVIKLCMDCNFK